MSSKQKCNKMSQFMNLAKSPDMYFTEKSLDEIDLELLGKDALYDASYAQNEKNSRFLIAHGVKMEFIDNFNKLDSLLDLVETLSIERIYDIMEAHPFRMKSLVGIWNSRKSNNAWIALTSKLATYYLLSHNLDAVDLIIKEFGIFPDGKNLSTVSMSSYMIDEDKNCDFLNKLIREYCLTGKIKNINMNDIIDNILTCNPYFNGSYYEILKSNPEISLSEKTIIKHFTRAYATEYFKKYKPLKILDDYSIHTSDVGNDIIDVYLKHGSYKPESIQFNSEVNELISREEYKKTSKKILTRFVDSQKEKPEYKNSELSDFNESLKKASKSIN